MTQYEKACVELAYQFYKKYLPDPCDFQEFQDELENTDGYIFCVGGDVTGVWYFENFDIYIDVREMHEYLRYQYDSEKMKEHYWYSVDEITEGKSPICIRDYLKLKK